MKSNFPEPFAAQYTRLLKCLALQGLSERKIESYSHGVRRVAGYFAYQLEALTRVQLTDYFAWLLAQRSWTAVKHDLYGLQFFYRHILDKPWPGADLVKAPKSTKLPDIVTVAQMQAIIAHTRVASYRVFFFVLYSLGLRLGEGLRLQMEDIDADRMQVHIRNAKGNRDRLVPLPDKTLLVLRQFWVLHRHPRLLFPSRQGGLAQAHLATSHMDRGGVQLALRQVVSELGIKKTLRLTACATVMPRI